MLRAASLLVAATASAWQPAPCNLITQWAKTLDPTNVLQEYPRPTMTRDASTYTNLNGEWEWEAAATPPDYPWITISATPAAVEAAAHRLGCSPPPVGQPLNGSILVPFPTESCLSGVGEQHFAMWYRLLLTSLPPAFSPAATRLLLHFGAADWNTTLYVNGVAAGPSHLGGYDRFHYDITTLVTTSSGATNELLVYVFDPSSAGYQPSGKQLLNAAGGDHYTGSSGIWGTVWLEVVPRSYIAEVETATTPDLSGIMVTATAEGDATTGSVNVTAWWAGAAVATGSGPAGAPVLLTIPQPQLWSPDTPNLYNLTITYCSGSGSGSGSGGCDTVGSYAGMRSISIGSVPAVAMPDTGPLPGIARSGTTLKVITPTAPDYNQCWEACNATAACVGWSYSAPSCGKNPSPQPSCILLKDYTKAILDNCSVSGLAAQPAGHANYTRPLLNGKPYTFVGWLDQSWWPDGQYTAPSDAALASDLQAVKDFGMNAVRLHQKVNSDRWLWHADVLGVAVLQDMPQRFGGQNDGTLPAFQSDLVALVNKTVRRHPCILQIEVCNESDSVRNKTFADAVPGMVSYLQSALPNHLVDTDSGGPLNSLHIGSVDDLHTYPTVGLPATSSTQYGMVGEWGGFGLYPAGHEYHPGKCWGYSPAPDSAQLANSYLLQIAVARTHKALGLSGVYYTQITDVEDECDGLLTYDRINKFTPQQLAAVAAANAALVAADV